MTNANEKLVKKTRRVLHKIKIRKVEENYKPDIELVIKRKIIKNFIIIIISAKGEIRSRTSQKQR